MKKDRKLTVAAAEAGGHYGDLSLALVWGPEGAVLETEVLCAVEDDCMLCGEGDRRHVCVLGVAGRGGRGGGWLRKKEEDMDGSL